MAEKVEITPVLAKFWNDVLGDGSFTYEDIRQRGGPSQPTLTKLTNGRGTISADSAKRLEDAIGLERGSLREVARGGVPRWKPEGAPGDEGKRLGWMDSATGEWRTVEDLFEGYSMASAYADYCWREGLSRAQYHELNDAIYHAWRTILHRRGSTRLTAVPDLITARDETDTSLVDYKIASHEQPEPAGGDIDE